MKRKVETASALLVAGALLASSSFTYAQPAVASKAEVSEDDGDQDPQFAPLLAGLAWGVQGAAICYMLTVVGEEFRQKGGKHPLSETPNGAVGFESILD